MKQVLEQLYIDSVRDFSNVGGVQKEFLIDGKLQVASGSDTIVTPLTVRGTYGSVPSLNAEESLQVLHSSVKARGKGNGVWPQQTLGERCEVVASFSDDMRTIRESVVKSLMYEIGKNKSDSGKEFDRTIEYIEKTIKAASQMHSDRNDRPGDLHTLSDRMPIGITLCMSPYNYPLNETSTTLIPALVMGNVAILKPARYGVLFWQHILPLFQKHFPAGAINTVYGDGETVITPLMESGKIDVLAFIGSGGVARKVAGRHPDPNSLKEVLGLGTKNPGIVTSTADIDNAVKECRLGSFSYNGHRCTAFGILFVQKKIIDLFTQKFVTAVEALKIGQPYGYYTTVNDKRIHRDLEAVSEITPMPDIGKVAAMHAFIEDALQKGATILNRHGGEFYHQLMVPAVLGNVTTDMDIMHKEQFGPVLPIVAYDDPQEVVDRVHNSPYGQQLSIFSQDPKEVNDLYSQLKTQVGRININAQCQRGPDEVAFSATKGSAVGTLSIKDALLEFSQPSVLAEKGSIGMM